MNLLNTHTPRKTKLPKANNHEFMSKALWKAIMVRSRLNNACMCNQNTTNLNNYRYQQKCCSIFLQKNKRKKNTNISVTLT